MQVYLNVYFNNKYQAINIDNKIVSTSQKYEHKRYFKRLHSKVNDI